jgi:hypothetical protein
MLVNSANAQIGAKIVTNDAKQCKIAFRDDSQLTLQAVLPPNGAR